ASSETCVIGSGSDVAPSMRIGESVGLTFLYVGGVVMVLGSCPLAALMAASTSEHAPSMLRERSNCRTIWVELVWLDDVISDTPGIKANCDSSGCATEDAMVSGSAPGRLADTWMVGKSTSGNGASGNCGYAMMPTKRMPTISNDVAMGRRMNGPEIPPAMLVSRSGLGLGGGGARSCHRY